ncbi:hypothetical protein [Nostoc sp. UHCC 0251]|uniref:hypothetical protein n=1 Tax=Nostoc sp. UHCC 0251 TaxID=3110240 RepID=UPI002B202D16|nr:hypothetical protein [Nostoc sp. UHCC 0251]MEA5627399.1 hypothetical protein [Nostoc sp. UHCC 0251]
MELNLIKVYDATLLSSSKVYQIDGTLSRYLGDEGTIQHPQYLFLPLPNQRKKVGASTFGGATFLDEPYSRVFGVSE